MTHLLTNALALKLVDPAETSRAMAVLYEAIPDIAESNPDHGMLKQVADHLFFTLLKNYHLLSQRYKVSGIGPQTTASSVYTVCATLSVLAGIGESPQISPEIVAMGLTYGPVNTLEELLNTLWLINARWHCLNIHDENRVNAVHDYLLALTRRSFYFVANELEPGDVGIVDEGLIREKVATPVTTRRLCETLCRLLCEVRVFFLPKAVAPTPKTARDINVLSPTIAKSGFELIKVPTIRQELREMLECVSVVPIDIPHFVERVRMEAYDPTITTMLARVQGFGAMQAVFLSCIDLVSLFGIREMDERYALFTENERAAAQLMKLHAVERILKGAGINFRADYVILPPFIVSAVPETLEERTPSLISLFGMFHVLFKGKLIVCPKGIEEAIHTWNTIVLDVLDGTLTSPNQASVAIQSMYKPPSNVVSENSKWARKVKY